MASSQFSMSEHRAALLKKFQGNGWALTCSPSSESEFSAILGDAVSALKKGDANAPTLDLPISRYESDWADTVLERSTQWRDDDGSAPQWVVKATEGWDFALFQLPAPDRRWIVKFAGRILEPFSYRFLGWADLHEIMAHGFLLDRTALMDGESSLAQLRKQRLDVLRACELIQSTAGPANSDGPDVVRCSVTGVRLHGLDTQKQNGNIEPDRWRSCADDFNRQLQKRLDRVFEAIRRKDSVAGSVMKRSIHCRNGHWTFDDSGSWMTILQNVPYDAGMVLRGKQWEVNFPESNDSLMIPDSAGIRAIARILMCNNIPCPCALVTDGSLLLELLGRPRHHKYFDAIYRRPRVECGHPSNGEVERAICAAMRFKEGWYYLADHVITEESELHTICGLPTGKVTLRRADALEGIRDLIRKQQVRLFFCNPPTEQFKRVLADIEAGIEFARKQEKLLEQVQSKSEESKGKIQKAIYRAKKELETQGDWMTRYDRLGNHFFDYIRGGLVVQYTGPYRWKVEGLPQTPDPLDLAADHVAFKRSKVAKAKRRAKAKLRALDSLKKLSKGAAC